MGLLGLMLLQDARRAARAGPSGEPILLEDQNRSLWNRDQIGEGTALVEQALSSRRFGPYALQAAIAAVHAEAETAAATDWVQIVGLYDVLAKAAPSPVIELNRAVAVAMRDGPAAGLALIDAILARGDLDTYRPAHAARAELCRRLGRSQAARVSYERALSLARQAPERRFLERRLGELEPRGGLDSQESPARGAESGSSERSVSRESGQATLVGLGAAGLAGLVIGLGLFTFHYGEGTAYLSDDPAACANCHIMLEQFDSWVKSSHHTVATCNACHLPSGPAHAWVSKADNGFFHSWAFTFRNHPDPIRIKPRNLRIAHDNCVGCHTQMVHDIVPDAHAGASVTCFHCHKDVGHAAWR